MKNLTLQLRLASLLSLILLACMAAYGQLTPVGDSYTNTAATSTNYGAQKLLDVESTQTTFIQFDLSAIPAGYTSADITKASLKLYVNAVTTAGSFNVDYVNGTWTESTIDASNAPALGTTIAASVPLITKDKNQYILVDVTTAVQAWLSGTPNDGIALVANSPLNASFDSKENTTTSHAAELDIVFAGGGTITGVTTASGSGLTGGGTSGTLNLALTACAKNQVLQYNGTSWACSSAGTGTITGVTAGTDLLGGPITGSGTLSIAPGGVTNTMLQQPSLTINTGAGLSGGGPVALGSSLSLSNTGVLAVGTTAGSGILVGGTAANPSLSADPSLLATNSSVSSAVSGGVTTAENFASNAVNTASSAITGSTLTLTPSSPRRDFPTRDERQFDAGSGYQRAGHYSEHYLCATGGPQHVHHAADAERRRFAAGDRGGDERGAGVVERAGPARVVVEREPGGNGAVPLASGRERGLGHREPEPAGSDRHA